MHYTYTYDTALFPHHIQQLQLDYTIPGRRFRRGRVPRPAPVDVGTSVSLDTVSSQSSAPALPLPFYSSVAFNPESSSLPPRAHLPLAAPLLPVLGSGLAPCKGIIWT